MCRGHRRHKPFSLETLEMFATTTSTDVTDCAGNRKICSVRSIGSELSYYDPDFVDDNTVHVYCGYIAMALLGEKGQLDIDGKGGPHSLSIVSWLTLPRGSMLSILEVLCLAWHNVLSSTESASVRRWNTPERHESLCCRVIKLDGLNTAVVRPVTPHPLRSWIQTNGSNRGIYSI
jgi:hypothetical protein